MHKFVEILIGIGRRRKHKDQPQTYDEPKEYIMIKKIELQALYDKLSLARSMLHEKSVEDAKTKESLRVMSNRVSELEAAAALAATAAVVVTQQSEDDATSEDVANVATVADALVQDLSPAPAP